MYICQQVHTLVKNQNAYHSVSHRQYLLLIHPQVIHTLIMVLPSMYLFYSLRTLPFTLVIAVFCHKLNHSCLLHK